MIQTRIIICKVTDRTKNDRWSFQSNAVHDQLHHETIETVQIVIQMTVKIKTHTIVTQDTKSSTTKTVSGYQN